MHIHFIGIGGIGMSALAQWYLSCGDTVSGSDLVASDITRRLCMAGADIFVGSIGHPPIAPDIDLVVHTAAVAPSHPELSDAKAKGIACRTYARALAPLTKQHKTIAIAGAHGKSTTTALTALVLEDSHFDPTVIVGTKLAEFGNTNFRRGYGGYLVLEADEYNKSFLHYTPHIAVLTNIDAEHLDTYGTVSQVQAAFAKFLNRVGKDGAIVANKDDARTLRVAKKFGRRVSWYSLDDPEARIVRRVLRVPGEHNISNALAALHVGRRLGALEPDILTALARFQGAWRRFELLGMRDGAFVVSDYAHHPREIIATLRAAREQFPIRRIWCIFQPHHYSRLASLWKSFHTAFDMADRVVILPVYEVAGRERAAIRNPRISAASLTDTLTKKGKDAYYLAERKDFHAYIDAHARAGDVLLFLGAGDIDDAARGIVDAPYDA
jgi:UDP-N-acetylmuramate--alanine ligase